VVVMMSCVMIVCVRVPAMTMISNLGLTARAVMAVVVLAVRGLGTLHWLRGFACHIDSLIARRSLGRILDPVRRYGVKRQRGRIEMGQEIQHLRIGALAAAAGVGVETIRYYQRRALLGEPARPHGGLRTYPAAYIDRIRFIKRAQRLGFSLEDIATLLALDSGTGHARAHALAAHRLAEIEAKIGDLEAMRATLTDLVRRCERTHGKVACPIIATLNVEPRAATRPKAKARGTAQRPRS
jgi:MerR family mercuric resistance operon transcriptional regulator